MIGPGNSGRSAAVIMICQPAWQLPIRQGRPCAFGSASMTASMNRASATQTSSMVWPGIGSGRKPTK